MKEQHKLILLQGNESNGNKINPTDQIEKHNNNHTTQIMVETELVQKLI